MTPTKSAAKPTRAADKKTDDAGARTRARADFVDLSDLGGDVPLSQRMAAAAGSQPGNPPRTGIDKHIRLGRDAVARNETLRTLFLSPADKACEAGRHALNMQTAHDEWVKEVLDAIVGEPQRKELLALRGKDRTNEAVAEDIDLVRAGAALAEQRHGEPLPDLPVEPTQAACDAYVHKAGLDGAVKLRGEGRTVAAIVRELGLIKLGADAFGAACPAVYFSPAGATQKDHDAWVKAANLPEGAVKLRGDGRTNAVVGAEIERIVAGARWGVRGMRAGLEPAGR